MRITERALRAAYWAASIILYGNGAHADWAYEKIQRPRNSLALARNLAAFYLKKPRIPTTLSIVVEPVFGCNLKCERCWGTFAPTLTGRRPPFMPMELFKKVVDQAPRSVESITFSLFGEPLMHPELPAMIAYAAEHGLRTVLFSNTTLLRGEVLSRIAAAPLNVLNVSAEPTAEHARNTRGIDLDEIRANVEAFLKAKRPETQVKLSMTVHPGNADVMGGTKKQWKGLIEQVKVSPRLILDANNPFTLCMELWRGNINVFSNGDVSPCCIDVYTDLAIGNLHTQTMDEILGITPSPGPNKYRQLLADMLAGKTPPRCQRCGQCTVDGMPFRMVQSKKRKQD